MHTRLFNKHNIVIALRCNNNYSTTTSLESEEGSSGHNGGRKFKGRSAIFLFHVSGIMLISSLILNGSGGGGTETVVVAVVGGRGGRGGRLFLLGNR